MKYRAKNLRDILGELWIYSPDTSPKITPLSLYHYTKSQNKTKIVNEEEGSVTFRLTKVSDFLDKNEGIYILEPYYHACGYLYNNNEIDFDFYSLLNKISPKNISRKAKNLWILCLTAEGYSKFMKERYAPNDGQVIELNAMGFYDLVLDFNSSDQDNYPNYMDLVEVQYSYSKMKKMLQDAIIKTYKAFKSDNSKSEKTKCNIVISTIESFLSKYNFYYKNSSYKNEKEIRLICYMGKHIDEWVDNENPGTRMYFEDKNLYLHFERDCYRQSMQNPDVFHAIELNKLCTTVQEYREIIKKRSKEFSH